MQIEDLQKFQPEYREAIILQCPDCPKEYEVNFCEVESVAINKCPKCGFSWVVE